MQDSASSGKCRFNAELTQQQALASYEMRASYSSSQLIWQDSLKLSFKEKKKKKSLPAASMLLVTTLPSLLWLNEGFLTGVIREHTGSRVQCPLRKQCDRMHLMFWFLFVFLLAALQSSGGWKAGGLTGAILWSTLMEKRKKKKAKQIWAKNFREHVFRSVLTACDWSWCVGIVLSLSSQSGRNSLNVVGRIEADLAVFQLSFTPALLVLLSQLQQLLTWKGRGWKSVSPTRWPQLISA